jgi:hypothetical protein
MTGIASEKGRKHGRPETQMYFSRENGTQATQCGISQGFTESSGVIMLANLPVLTDAIQKAICHSICKGIPRKSAARIVGVSPRTLRRWMRCGKQGAEPYVQFRKAVLNAEATAESEMVAIVFQTAKKNVAYARWWLELKCATHWSKSRRLAMLEQLLEQRLAAAHAERHGQGGTNSSHGSASAGEE